MHRTRLLAISLILSHRLTWVSHLGLDVLSVQFTKKRQTSLLYGK